MDWLRRNWPDLIIGVALVAVIAGIVVTLLSGGSFLSLGGREDVNRSLASPSAVQTDVLPPDASNSGAQAGIQDGAQPDVNVQPGAGNVDGAAGSAADTTVVVPPAADDGNAEATGTIVPVVPDSGAQAGVDATPQTTAPSSSVQTDQLNSPDISEAPGNGAANVTAPAIPLGEVASGGADGLADAATQGGVYRVSVDAYASQENAQRRAADLRGDGYPVFIGRQGDLYLVLVGPYDSNESANSAAQRLRDTGLSADAYVVVYRPDEAGATGGLSLSGATDTSTDTSTNRLGAATTAGAQGAIDTVNPNPLQDSDLVADASSAEGNAGTASTNGASGRYLQVGAFATSASAEPRLTRLESLGYSVTQDNDNNVIKLFVGPFAPTELPAAQARLDAQGIENFPISQ